MNRIGIMQPYLFPYLGYYALIQYTDYFVLFDTPQYIRKGWINRNRILDAKGEPCYFTVPVEKAERERSILYTKISNTVNWKQKIEGQLLVYKKKAPYYEQTMSVVADVLNYQGDSICELAGRSIKKVCDYLDIKRQIDFFSKMQIDITTVEQPDEWALYITKALGYETYVNPPGGMSFFRTELYKEHNIDLQFLKIQLQPYVQRNGNFQEGLSIIDAMMFCKPDEIIKMLDNYMIIKE